VLFDASPTYAPGEPRGVDGTSSYQRIGKFGHDDLSMLKAPNVLIALAVLVAIAYYLHRRRR
jgi:hypothetical protein